jgi:hypothetical protein
VRLSIFLKKKKMKKKSSYILKNEKKKATDSKKHTQSLYTSWQRNSSITKEKRNVI